MTCPNPRSSCRPRRNSLRETGNGRASPGTGTSPTAPRGPRPFPSVRARRGTGAGVFTFLEILIAVAILGISLALALQVIGAARARLLRAERRWARQHNLDQAVEFFLLAGPDASLPEGLLPEGFTASCTLEATPVDELPDFVSEQYFGWTLARYRVTLTWRGSATVQEQVVEKIVRTDAIP